MPGRAVPVPVDILFREAMRDAVRHASRAIAQTIAELAAAEISAQLQARAVGPARGRRRTASGRKAGSRGTTTRWVADRRARRVPSFVIELTGLETKRQIVARYGTDAAFEKGKPAPRADKAGRAGTARP